MPLGGGLPRLLVEDVDDPAFLQHFAGMGLTPPQEVGGWVSVCLCVCAGFEACLSLTDVSPHPLFPFAQPRMHCKRPSWWRC